MAYSILTSDKTISVSADGVTNSHVGTVYGGLKNDITNKIDGNLAASMPTVTSSLSWCNCSLSKVDDTAAKILCTVSKNTGASRTATVKLNYNGIETSNKLTISLSAGSTPVQDVTLTIRFYISDYLSVLNSLDNILFSTVLGRIYPGNSYILENVRGTNEPTFGANFYSTNITFPKEPGLFVHTKTEPGNTDGIYCDTNSTLEIYATILGSGIECIGGHSSDSMSLYRLYFRDNSGTDKLTFNLKNWGTELKVYKIEYILAQ